MIGELIVVISFWVDVSVIIFMLVKQFGFKKSLAKPGLKTIMAVFMAVGILTVIHHMEADLFLLYLGVVMLFAILYSIFFIEGKFIYKYTTVTVYMCAIVTNQLLAVSILNGFMDRLPAKDFMPGTYILSKLLLIITGYLLSRWQIKVQYDLPISYWSVIILVPTLNFISLLMFKGIDTPNAVFIPFLIFTLILNILLYVMFSKIVHDYEDKIQYYMNTEHLQLQLQSYVENKKTFDTLQGVRHDLKNQLLCMKIMLEKKQYRELERYLSQFSGEMLGILTKITTGNNVIDTVLNAKNALAHVKNIPIEFKVTALPDIAIKDFELCALLSNLLDNAIEASEQTKNPQIVTIIGLQGNCLTLSISNKTDENVFVKNPGLKTTKKDKQHHGIGLQVIRSIVDYYEGDMSIGMKNGYFNTDIILNLPA